MTLLYIIVFLETCNPVYGVFFCSSIHDSRSLSS